MAEKRTILTPESEPDMLPCEEIELLGFLESLIEFAERIASRRSSRVCCGVGAVVVWITSVCRIPRFLWAYRDLDEVDVCELKPADSV
ncbi:hypothetical protein NDU88_005708 [Pleurodeles waltl]|uniref:Uncharacterized protein n=1 Tax=Pleurodeles waltl TaxID=8319 RepID=A0AAV7TBD4_PLEWA|nr:hypothetical protein NDU88_005708 [Pleurodeles waltl]